MGTQVALKIHSTREFEPGFFYRVAFKLLSRSPPHSHFGNRETGAVLIFKLFPSSLQENGLLSWLETSSRDHSNVNLAVRRLVEYILETDPSVKVAKENAKFWGKI